MIKSVQIANIASYSTTPQLFGELKTVNYVYGSNGSGKTTISRIIANPDNYVNCHVFWTNGQPLISMVYNRDFVARNFKPSTEIKGVFTLGTGDDSVLKQIEFKKEAIEALENKIDSLTNDLDGPEGKKAQLTTANKTLSDYCWDTIKAAYDSTFSFVFEGVNNSKAKLVQRVLDYYSLYKDDAPIRTRDELVAEAKVVFNDSSIKYDRIQDIDFSRTAKSLSAAIFGQAIIGSPDVNVSELISILGISDWVRQGWTFLSKSQGKCPFCQQQVPENLEEQFRQYFDKSFEKNISVLEQSANECRSALQELMASLDDIQDISNPLFDVSSFVEVKKQIESKIELVQTRLEQKRAEPSRMISMPEFKEEATYIRKLISEANKKSDEQNMLLDNRKSSRKRLVSDIWHFIIKEYYANLSTLISNKQNLEKAKSGLEKSISEKTREKDRLIQELHVLEKQRTSVRPTIDAINEILKTFGFNSFKLAAASETTYMLQRPNGETVGETLSEGERSFVTFLYFYHLLKGGETADSVNSGRVAIFDDPVSSLDADVLFVVSSLVRRCIDDLRNGEGNVKQIIVLTHNVYFHKEVTFDPRRKKGLLIDETFWIVKKRDGSSLLLPKQDNPIKTSYELLWDELKNPEYSLTGLRNTMRRILEYYFRILGGWNDWNLNSWFDGLELSICQSLLSWANDGSHFPDDDLHYRVSPDAVEAYKKVFKCIFEKTGHIEHYKMMMQIE